LSLQPMPMTQEEFSAYFRKDVNDTAAAIEKAKIQIP